MTRPAPVRTDVTFDEYLRLEHDSLCKHEYVDGKMYRRPDENGRHNRVTGRTAVLLMASREKRRRNVYLLDLKVRVPDGPVYYPDVFVTCEDDDNAYIKRKPCLIAEVLSPSTEAVDRGEKLLNYQKLEALQTYVLLSQDLPRAEVYRRLADGWRYESKEAGRS